MEGERASGWAGCVGAALRRGAKERRGGAGWGSACASAAGGLEEAGCRGRGCKGCSVGALWGATSGEFTGRGKLEGTVANPEEKVPRQQGLGFSKADPFPLKRGATAQAQHVRVVVSRISRAAPGPLASLRRCTIEAGRGAVGKRHLGEEMRSMRSPGASMLADVAGASPRLQIVLEGRSSSGEDCEGVGAASEGNWKSFACHRQRRSSRSRRAVTRRGVWVRCPPSGSLKTSVNSEVGLVTVVRSKRVYPEIGESG